MLKGVNFTTFQNPNSDTKKSDSSTDSDSGGGLLSKVAGKIKKVLQPKDGVGGKNEGLGDLGMMDTGVATAKKGGKVLKSGYVKLHRGEKVLTRKQAKKYGPRKSA